MARPRSVIERFLDIGRQQPLPPPNVANQPYYYQPCNITPVSSTVGLDRSYVRNEFELDVAPLKRFIKKMFPFVIDISYLKVDESKYTDGRRILDNPQIKLIVSPAHRTELYSEDIEDKVKNHIREKLIPLLRTMYEINSGFILQIHFGSERSETILEYLKEE
jgi:hypothetical protein